MGWRWEQGEMEAAAALEGDEMDLVDLTVNVGHGYQEQNTELKKKGKRGVGWGR